MAAGNESRVPPLHALYPIACAKALTLAIPPLSSAHVVALACLQCLGAKGRHLAEYEMEDPRVVAVITSLMGWEAMGNSLRRN